MQNLQGVLFDLDGTLANTLRDLAEAVNYALREMDFPTHPVDTYKFMVGRGAKNLIRQSLPEEHRQDKNILRKVQDVFAGYYREHYMDWSEPYPGMQALIKELHESGVKLAVVTNKPDPFAKLMVEKIYPGLFQAVIGQREGVPIKPDPHMPEMALKAIGVDAPHVAFVGDSGVDIETGINCGLYSIGVLWGFRSKEELLESGATLLAADAGELAFILQSLEEYGR